MARIYRRTDRIVVKIDDITVKLAPLTLHQKTEIQQTMIKSRTSMDIREATRGIALSIQCSLKGLEGVEDMDGNPYKLQFEDDLLTEACVDDLMNLELTKKLTMVCASMVNGIPKEFADNNGVPIEGVEIVAVGVSDSEKKS